VANPEQPTSYTIAYLIALLLLTSACSPRAESPSPAGKDCVESFDPARDYFPQKTSIEFAENFSAEYHKSYKIVTVRRPSQNRDLERYVLVQCGAPLPKLSGEVANAPVVSVPVTSLFSDSATHMPLLVELGHVDVLTGINEADYVTTQPVIDRIRRGLAIEYAPNYVINVELVVAKAPSMMMVGGGYPEDYKTIRKAGIPVVLNTEWEESTALGRAEWLKYMALFLNEEGKAQRSFDAIRDRYMALRESTGKIAKEKRPRVMTGVAARGLFEVSGGASYVAGLIADAGGVYVWSDNTSTGVMTVDLEAQIARASTADFWINGGKWKSLKAMLLEDPRYREFKPVREGQVWLYDRLVNEVGAYDYWSRGVTRPDIILEDLIKIFHPELAAEHELVWYKQVPAE
jgi:iron complex transport system substrate-binding protein